MHVSFSTLIKAQVKRIVTALHARTYRRVRRLQKEVTTHRGILRRLERRLDASVPRRGRPPAVAAGSGIQIRAARERSGLSRQAFAKRLGVSQGAVYLWESGRSTPRGANAQRLRVFTAGGDAAGARRTRKAARKRR